MEHYTIFRKSLRHDAYFAYAASAQEAMRSYLLNTYAFEGENGQLELCVSGAERRIFSHELEAIECCEKAVVEEWSMQKVPHANWTNRVVHDFTGYNPWDVAGYMEHCRKAFGATLDLPKGWFAWYLETGPLITFFQPREGGIILPEDIKYRLLYYKWTEVVEWTGDYNQLMSEFKIS
jgi:hypothetical protein